MANKKIESLTEIKEAVAATSAVAETKRKPSRDKQGRSYATGKRKNAVARVWIMPGKGNITINEKPVDTYFARPVLKMIINQPFEITNRENEFDVVCTVQGGGLSGQAGAIKHGISKALNEYEPELRSVLKQAGFLTRDDRVVERKKYGRAKARRSFVDRRDELHAQRPRFEFIRAHIVEVHLGCDLKSDRFHHGFLLWSFFRICP